MEVETPWKWRTDMTPQGKEKGKHGEIVRQKETG
jgi:hypothetical protein